MNIYSWKMAAAGEPLARIETPLESLQPEDVLVKISGCGVCHTDLGFYFDGVKTVKPLPLTLGHEISGFVIDAGPNAKQWISKAVIVPAVMPCGTCNLCVKGQGRICRSQKMPGNHIEGGFASHIVVPSRYLCRVDVTSAKEPFGKSGVTLPELSVVADAVTTPYQAAKSAELSAGDIAIFIGIGGIGGYGVQIAKAMGAHVVAIDVDNEKLSLFKNYGADLILNPIEVDSKAIRKSIQTFVKDGGFSPFEWKIFETSGTVKGQELAYSLLTFGSTLSVVGFTMDQIQLRLSNLMAYDARAIGNWGCHPKFYPDVLEWVRDGRIKIGPFVELFPLDEINSVFEKSHRKEIKKRPVMVPAD